MEPVVGLDVSKGTSVLQAFTSRNKMTGKSKSNIVKFPKCSVGEEASHYTFRRNHHGYSAFARFNYST